MTFTRYFSVLGLLSCLGSPALAQSVVAGQSPDEQGSAEMSMGQDPGLEAAVLQPAIATQLTARSHSIGPNSSASNLEGNACPAPTKMISGACHPGYNDRVIIINQFPNINGNTWRCGFRNNNTVQRTVWIYTVCGQ